MEGSLEGLNLLNFCCWQFVLIPPLKHISQLLRLATYCIGLNVPFDSYLLGLPRLDMLTVQVRVFAINVYIICLPFTRT